MLNRHQQVLLEQLHTFVCQHNQEQPHEAEFPITRGLRMNDPSLAERSFPCARSVSDNLSRIARLGKCKRQTPSTSGKTSALCRTP